MSQLGVALVSAGSALTGATIGGLFTLLKGRQEARERQADREEQRRQQRLDNRRTAYVAFLKALSEAEDKLHLLYEFKVPETLENFEVVERPVITAFNQLLQAKLEVEMVGPAVMAAQAERVLERVMTIIEEYEGAFEHNKDRPDPSELIALVPGQGRLSNRLSLDSPRGDRSVDRGIGRGAR
ncbi:hypothetical protein FNV65_43800 [Streptomyces sp. S1A1-8]|uniref:hypothetical protein n=1 Tax=unclassified Streptomyces TaxID=2593676 RepID=UPI00116286EB|nr:MULTISPECIES: hypothetical protein [unclassified Streptomyces]QDO02197.1 hypothetical protein FNV58_45215 [Streptomyces sp. RLB1-9]QDO23932.1 hypothetical protein FNV65_43800 [Streptomyces sp. S1A1-8]QDO34056.1 hypothetical protein FNV63_43825 [Streptomyces sp. S1A1-3]